MDKVLREAAKEFGVPVTVLKEILSLEQGRTHLLDSVRKKELAPKIQEIIERHARE